MAGGVVLAVAAPASASAQQWRQVDAGTYYTCGTRADSTLWCWGTEISPKSGDDPQPHNVPVRVDPRTGWSGVSVGTAFACALRQSSVYCWGENSHGQLGLGDTDRRIAPTRVAGGPYLAVSAGLFHACALDLARNMWCWGDNDQGELGVGDLNPRLVPTRVPSGHWASVSADGLATCAISVERDAYCWGLNDGGAVGSGDTSTELVTAPTRVAGGLKWLNVDTGFDHACGVTTTHRLACWGYGTHGRDATGTITSSPVPELIGVRSDWADATVGEDFFQCARTLGGAAYCWGENFNGELGLGDTDGRTVPAPLPGHWSSLSAGDSFTCGILPAGPAQCWGSNDFGQLGAGDFDQHASPTPVQ
jgi:alpha-tubulin suppressor-like RCC1 family protein